MHMASQICISTGSSNGLVPSWSSMSKFTGPWGRDFHFKCITFKCGVLSTFISISSVIASRWMPQDHTEDESRLVQVMAWCRQAPSHCLSQSWQRSRCHMLSLEVTWLYIQFNELYLQVTVQSSSKWLEKKKKRKVSLIITRPHFI